MLKSWSCHGNPLVNMCMNPARSSPEFPEHRGEPAGPEHGDTEDSALPKRRHREHQNASGHEGEAGSRLQRSAGLSPQAQRWWESHLDAGSKAEDDVWNMP